MTELLHSLVVLSGIAAVSAVVMLSLVGLATKFSRGPH